MKKITVLNKSILTALCVALCVVLPMTLHAIPKGGVLFSPMHLPVLLCGLVCGAPFGLVCGILGPLVSSLLTGMPVFGYMPVMMIELGLYGLISGLVMQFLRSGKLVVDLYAALVIAMPCDHRYPARTDLCRRFLQLVCLGYRIFRILPPRYHYPADSDPHPLCGTGTRSSPAGSLRCCFCCRRDRSCINPYTLEPAGSSHHSKMAPLSYDRRAIFCL